MVIYEIVNTKNNKRYIGQTTQTSSVRWSDHKYDLNTNRHDNPHLQNAWNKYGAKTFIFQVLSEAGNMKELNELEIHYINTYRTQDSKFGYNLRSGGSNGKHSIESRKRISNSLMGKRHSAESGVRKSRTRRKSGYPPVMSPKGKLFKILDLTNFCREHNLHTTGMFDLVNGKCRHYKQWTLVGTDLSESTGNLISKKHRPAGYPSLLGPDNKIYKEIINLRQFCLNHSLTPSNLSAVVHGRAKSHKGWKLISSV